MSSPEVTPPSPVDPQTVSTRPASGCCGGPAPAATDACCARDADVKAAGGPGCGCGAPAPTPATPQRTRSGCC
jgi:hypothetical protein